MKSYRLIGAALTDADHPIFKFEAELHDGEDLDGKFQIQFAAVEQDGDRRFAINSPQGLLGIFAPDDSRRLATALAETGGYTVAVNYENVEWQDAPHSLTVPLLGRFAGKNFDHEEHCTLDTAEFNAVRQIRAALVES